MGFDSTEDRSRYRLTDRYAFEVSRTLLPAEHSEAFDAFQPEGDQVSELAGRLGFVQTVRDTHFIPYVGVGQRSYMEHWDYGLTPGAAEPGRYLYAPIGLDVVSETDPMGLGWSWSARAEYDHVFDAPGAGSAAGWVAAPHAGGENGYGFRLSATVRQGLGSNSLVKGVQYTPYFEYWRLNALDEGLMAGEAADGTSGSETWGFRVTAEF